MSKRKALTSREQFERSGADGQLCSSAASLGDAASCGGVQPPQDVISYGLDIVINQVDIQFVAENELKAGL